MRTVVLTSIIVLASFIPYLTYGASCSSPPSDWDKVRELREWTHSNADMGTACIHESMPPNWYNDVFWAANATTMFEMFDNDEAVVMCQGMAFALSELYRDNGYEAYILGIGIPNAATHSITLVEIEHNGQPILVIQDPMFDLTYTYPNGEPYDYLELLRVLKEHRHDEVVVEEGSLSLQDYIACASNNITGLELKFGTVPEQLPDGRWKFRITRPDDAWIEIAVRGSLLADGYPSDPIYLFLYLLYILDDYDPNYGVGALRPNILLEQEARAILNAS